MFAGFERGDGQPGESHDEREERGRARVLRAPGRGNGHEGAVGEQRGEGDRARLQVRARREDARRKERQRRGIEAVDGREARQFGVGHALGDDEEGDAQSGQQVAPGGTARGPGLGSNDGGVALWVAVGSGGAH